MRRSSETWDSEATLISEEDLRRQRVAELVRAKQFRGLIDLLNPRKKVTARALIIGDGTFSVRAVRQVRKRLFDALWSWDTLATVGLFAIDSDHQPTSDWLATGDVVLDGIEPDPAEFGDLAISTGALRDYTEVGGALSWHYWLPEEVLRIELQRSGFAASPPAGRSGILFNRNRIKQGLKNVINCINGNDETNRARASGVPIANAYTGSLDVYLLTALLGGSGAGSFIEVARIVREIKRETAQAIHLMGLVALPGAVKAQDGGRKARANALALLRELNVVMTDEFICVRKHSLDDEPTLQQDEGLFDLVLLVDNAVNGGG